MVSNECAVPDCPSVAAILIRYLDTILNLEFVLYRFIDRGEFGEVYQGTAIDILGPDAGPTPVAVKVLEYCSS